MDSLLSEKKLRKSEAISGITKEDIQSISDDLKLRLSPEETDAVFVFSKETLKSYQKVYELISPSSTVKYPRTPGYRDTTDNAWYYRCDIKGADSGLLAGKTVAIKDNVCVAGVPMMNGSKLLEGFVPDRDATIVTRILDAGNRTLRGFFLGGRIVGKSVSEDMCFSASSFTSSYGPLRNPFDPTRSCGGSSSGSGSLVARQVVDVAIGGDQGGSIRIPASWCGIVGLKPTYGLVPYTGIIPIEMTLDHVGPMAKTVEDCAALLEVIAGYDGGNDPRQFPTCTHPPCTHPPCAHPPYSKLVNEGIQGKKVGILMEGFQGVEEDLAVIVRDAALNLRAAGAEVGEVSLPIHNDGLAIWTPIDFEGAYHMLFKGNGNGYGWKGEHDLLLQDALARGNNLRPFDCSLSIKIVKIFSEYMERNYQNKFYAKAQNLAQHLTSEYNRILEVYDVIVMPTCTGKPFKLPTTEDSISDPLEQFQPTWNTSTYLVEREMKGNTLFQDAIQYTLKLLHGMKKNTTPFNATGHPAISVNVGHSEGLPCGMMIVGRMFDDLAVLKVARAVEKIRDSSS